MLSRTLSRLSKNIQLVDGLRSHNKPVPNRPEWNLINNFTITLGEAVVESATVPEDPGLWLGCIDAHFNDTELFEAELPLFVGDRPFRDQRSAR